MKYELSPNLSRGYATAEVRGRALANKNARIVWAVLAKGRVFDPNHVPVKRGEIVGAVLAID